MARNSGEPPKSGVLGAQRWADYLDWVRMDVIRGTLRLPPTERRLSRVPSGWSPLELLSHVLHMEQRWFIWGFLGESVEGPWADWDVPDPTVVDQARWQVPLDITAEQLANRLQEIGKRTREILASYPLDTVASVGGRFDAEPPTLEWICFHVLAEYARHAGQLDIVVELGSHNR